jgi:biotin carboxyl carrier protein
MDYEITIGGRSSKVALARAAGEAEQYAFTDSATGRSGTIEVVERAPSRLILSIAHKMFSVRPRTRVVGRVEFLLNGEPVTAELSAARASPTTGVDRGSVPELVIAHFPAKVVRVPVSPGSFVKERDPLIVLEAMKMVTHIDAPRDCTVVETFVNEGEMVARGTKLARLRFT